MIGRGGGRGRVVYFIQVKPDTLECAESAKKVLKRCFGSPFAHLLPYAGHFGCPPLMRGGGDLICGSPASGAYFFFKLFVQPRVRGGVEVKIPRRSLTCGAHVGCMRGA